MKPRREKNKTIEYQSIGETRLVVFWVSLKTLVLGLVYYATLLWKHNPLRIIAQRQRRLYFVENYGEVMIKPHLKERVMDIFLSDYRRRQRLLNWVHSKNRNTNVTDFTTSWQDGVALCSLLESICPGVCPSYHLLSHHNRVKNCRLGLKLANKYLYVPMDFISPEEMAIANKSVESKIIQYVYMLMWASENIKEKWTSLHESLIAAKSGRCFAKGSGLRNGIVGKRSKFTIIVSDTIGVFNMLVEIRGPNNEYCGERLVSLHQAKGVLDKSFDINNTYSDTIKYLEDGAGNTFVRKKVPPRYVMDSSELIHLDFQSGEEGTFYVTFVPHRAGLHTAAVKWQNHHVENSPFRIKVYKASNVSANKLKGAQEKRVIYDSLSFTTYGSENGSHDSLDNLEVKEEGDVIETGNREGRSLSAIAKSKANSKGRQLTVTRRRVLRRIITRNGEAIVIEEAISPSMSRQSSVTDNSDEDYRTHRKDKEDKRPSLNTNMTFLPLSMTSQSRGMISQTPTMNPQSRSMTSQLPNMTSQSTSMSSQAPNMTQQNTTVSLKTNPEKKQNSNEENVEDANKPLSLKDHAVIQADAKAESPKRQEHVATPVIPVVSNERQSTKHEQLVSDNEENRWKNTCVVNTVSIGSTKDNDANKLVTKESDTRKAEINGTMNYQSIWFDCQTSDERLSQRNRSPLQRGDSIHACSKAPARRASSDGPLYKLRKQAVRKAHSDKSDTGSDMSSDDNTRVTDDDTGTLSQTLTVLHSNSLSKSCTYFSNKGLDTAVTSSGDDDVFVDITFEEAIKELESLTSPKSEPICRHHMSKYANIPFTEGKRWSDNRPVLRRQWKMIGQRSSTSSSGADKKILKKRNSIDSSHSKDSTSVLKFDFEPVEQGLNLPFKGETGKESADDVYIVMPKAKVDKNTQVNEYEIKKETGWDVIENLFLLVQKVSIKVPTKLGEIFENPGFPSNAQKCIAITENDVSNETLDKQQMDIKFPESKSTDHDETRPNEAHVQHKQANDKTKHSRVDAWLENNGVSLVENNGVSLAENNGVSLVENNGVSLAENNGLSLMEVHQLSPFRQLTVETNDSGFDDNLAYNRQARFSLPSLRAVNGHVRLHRRPYKGHILLDRKLVVSSGQSVSLDQRELGHEADDELIHNSSLEQQAKQQRKRHRMPCRTESISMSDSEINQRRYTNKRKVVQSKGYLGLSCVDNAIRKPEPAHEYVVDTQDAHKQRRKTQDTTDEHIQIPENDINQAVSEVDSADGFDVNKEYGHAKDISSNGFKAIPNRTSRASTQSMSSSIDSTYFGFGVSKHGRDVLVSQLGDFQRLFPEEELANEDVFELENAQSNDEQNNVSDHVIETTEKTFVEEDPDVSENDDLTDAVLKRRRKSWECDLSDGSYETDQHEEDTSPDTNLSSLGSGSGLDDTVHEPENTDNDFVFDMFSSSFDHSYMNDVLPRQSSTGLSEEDEVFAAKNEPAFSDCNTVVKVAGAGHKHGQVGTSNSFQVWVDNPSAGSLSVNVIGPRPHSVTETSIIYTGDNLYEVSYGVTHPGFYKIFLRWGSEEVPECPFICEVTM